MSVRERASIEAELLTWMRERPWCEDEERFDRLALELFAFQYDHCEPYRGLCRSRGRTPERVASWREIPAVPSGAFKEMPLRCFPADRTRAVFRTSGTGGQRRGELHLDTLDLYEASLLPPLEQLLFPDLAHAPQPPAIRVLAASPEEAPDSSLSHMFGVLLDRMGSARSGYDVVGQELRVDGLMAAIREARHNGESVALCGTAFAFVHLLELLEASGETLCCPEGSRIMETGGFKGRSRAMPRGELYEALSTRTGVPESRIVNQYGMTELGSQFYDSILVDPTGPRRKLGPPWTRVRLIEPESGRDVSATAAGTVVIHDLANTGSVAAIETADLGRRVPSSGGWPGGFEVLGRQPGAETRGCSIAMDAMLGTGR